MINFNKPKQNGSSFYEQIVSSIENDFLFYFKSNKTLSLRQFLSFEMNDKNWMEKKKSRIHGSVKLIKID